MVYTFEEFLKLKINPKCDCFKEDCKCKTREELEDEYYDALGKIIEEHPIGTPGSGRFRK